MHAVHIDDDGDDKYHGSHHSGGSRSALKKGGFWQRVTVQFQVLGQRCCGFQGSSAGGKSKPNTSSSCWNIWTVLLLVSQFLLVGYIISQNREIDSLEHELGRVSSSTTRLSGALSNWINTKPSSGTQFSRDTISTLSDNIVIDNPEVAINAQRAAVGVGGGPAAPTEAPQSKPIESDQLPISTPSTTISTSSSSSSSQTSINWQWQVDSYEREKEIYVTIADREASMTPAVVRAFREGRFEWHNAQPEYEHSTNGDLEFSRLVAGEVATTKFLTYDFNLHRYWNWGQDHGPLKDYAHCRKVNDKCTIHGRADCLNNGACGWCTRIGLCVDRLGKPQPYDEHEHKPICEPTELELGPQNTNLKCRPGTIKLFQGGHQRDVTNPAECKITMADRFIDTSLNNNAGAMYYHFIKEHFELWYSSNFANGAISDRYSHIIVTGGSMDHFHDYYGIFTKICPKYAKHIPDGTCFCQRESSAGEAIIPADGHLPTTHRLTDAMVTNLGLENIFPPTDRPALGLLSRENKRFILNELDLAKIAIQMGVSIKLLPLEYMTIYEQVREFRRLHFLTGIHGSGLTNYFLLHANPGTHTPGFRTPISSATSDAEISQLVTSKSHYNNYCLQILPHQVKIGGEGLRGFAGEISCRYEEWVQPLRSNTVLHTHFLNQQDFRNLEALMQVGPTHEDSAFFSFWVNQDTIVHPDHWRELIRKMIEA